LEAAALLKSEGVKMVYDINKEKLNLMFGFEEREFFLASAVMAKPMKKKKVEPIEFSLPYVEGSGTFEQNKLIEQAYQETKDLHACQKLFETSKFDYQIDKLKETIFTRRSQRGFDGEAITKGQFNFIMEMISQPISSDCDEEVSVYTVLNRVVNMPLGVQKDGEFINYGDFARKAGYLCLEQYSLGQTGAVTFFLTSKASNYQALYQKAGIIGHRLYIASNYLGIGCSGIGAYYDDEVNVFLENDEMVLYALAIGR
jgi:hypothetical protein